MAEKMKLVGNTPPSSFSKFSNYRDCMCTILSLFADFGNEIHLGEAVLKINVNIGAVDLPSSPSAHVYSCLQQHISKLQAVSESLKTLADAEDRRAAVKDGASGGNGDVSQGDKMTTDPERPPPTAPRNAPEADGCKSQADDFTVQIRAPRSEIDRRISAFMERKQMEINENNVREFCNVIDCNQENSCARTDAVFTPYPGFKSHVKVTRVVNTYGPQTRGAGGQGEPADPQRSQVARDCGNPAVEERLQNIESHLRLPAAGPAPMSVYQRLKRLEDRILELEGLSPEYFQSTSYLHKRPKVSSSQACSLSELDGKISAVKAALLKRVTDFGPGYGTECPL